MHCGKVNAMRLWVTLTLICTCVLAQKKVLEVTGTNEDFGGLYMQTTKDDKFRKLGGPDAWGYHFFLFKKGRDKWFIGDRKQDEDDEKITDSYYAWVDQRYPNVPPKYGWRIGCPIFTLFLN